MRSLSENDKRAIVEYLSQRMKAYAIVLFGSAAQDRLRADSDIDLAFLSDLSYSPFDLFWAAGDLAARLGREVDLINLAQASTVLQAQIAANGILLLDERPLDRQYVFMRILKAYALLNEERQLAFREFDQARSPGHVQGHPSE